MADLADERFRADVPGFYAEHHRLQTRAAAAEKRAHWGKRRLGCATVRERFEALAGVRDESDGDLHGMSQLGHALQTANAILGDGLDEDWIVLGLIHDLGKILVEGGEHQAFVVGDTYPLACAWSPNIRHFEALEQNEDWHNRDYRTPCGIYEPGCGLDAVEFTFGHDEYLYQLVRDLVPDAIAWTIRYHSFQSVADDYAHLFDARDRELRASHMAPFARYDLYTKDPRDVSRAHLEAFCAILDRRFPDALDW